MELVTVISVLAFALGFAALVVGLLTNAELSKRDQKHTPAITRKPADKSVRKETVDVRRERAVLMKQQDNFMNYDGDVQDPIDPDTILADSGE